MTTMAFWKGKKQKGPAENPEEKKPGLIRRLWRKFRAIDWKNPVNRWKALFTALALFIVMLGFIGGAIAATNSPSFCKVCHEMAPEHVTFEASSHSQATCVDCHIAPGNVEMVLHKIGSLKEVYYHITGVPDPIVQTVAVLDENCEKCHSKNRLISADGDLIVNHEDHIKEGIPCVTCHSGVVHAKVVERNINGSTTYDDWTKENGEKLMGKKNMDPNMGTCIDCHTKVNEGKKPWKDYSYRVPENPHEKEKGKKTDSSDEKEETKAVSGGTEKAIKVSHQDAVLQVVDKQQTDVKLSMECSTCHKSTNTPENHQNIDWSKKHGEDAIQQLDKCIDCHQDQKWNKVIADQNINELLKGTNDIDDYTANVTIVKNEVRKNQFCSTCHENRPPSHTESYQWLTDAHADNARTAEEKARCFVCHDRDKVVKSTTSVKSQNDVYCQYCHRTGFKGDYNN